jgi:hypothetical protein
MKPHSFVYKLLIVFTVFSAGAINAQVTNNQLNLKFPVNAKMSPQFKAAVERQQKQYKQLMGWNKEIRNFTPAYMLEKIDTSPDYNDLYIAEYWIAYNYQAMIPELIKRVSNNTEIGLVESMDLVIPERVASGQMADYPNGQICEDDLFSVAGRANRLLKVITGEDFGDVSMKSSPFALKDLQNKWVEWFKTL